MADNVELPGDGETVATDFVDGKHYQRVKIDVGGEGAAMPLSETNPLPISGTVTAKPSGTYSATVTVLNSSLPVTGTFYPDTQPVSGSLTVNAGNGTFSVAGTVGISNLPAVQPVSGEISISNFPVSQTVAGTVTANAGSGTFATTSTVNNWPSSYPVTDNGGSLTVDGTVAVSSMPEISIDTTGLATYSAQVTTNALLDALGTGTFAANVTVLNPVSTVTANAGSGTFSTSGTQWISGATGTFSTSGTVAVSNMPSIFPQTPAMPLDWTTFTLAYNGSNQLESIRYKKLINGSLDTIMMVSFSYTGSNLTTVNYITENIPGELGD